jgi:hypothetical protein
MEGKDPALESSPGKNLELLSQGWKGIWSKVKRRWRSAAPALLLRPKSNQPQAGPQSPHTYSEGRT